MAVVVGLVLLIAFGAGLLALALVLLLRNCDASSAYTLFAARDRLIGAVVFDGVDRSDPWLEWLYQGVNSVLTFSHHVAGPGKWLLASKVGRASVGMKQAGNPKPNTLPDAALVPIITEIDKALDHLVENHIGTRAFLNARKAEALRLQKEAARRMRDELGRTNGLSASAA